MKKVAIIRGKFLNRYEMQFFEPLVKDFAITAFGSLTPYHDRFAFPVVKLPSPMDLPDFPYKMPILNRLFIDAHYLVGLEEKLRRLPAGRQGFDLVHSAETYYHYTQQALNAKKRGYVKKVVATVLETIPFNNEGIWGRTAFKARARQELDGIIALTQKSKQALVKEGADPKKITVIGHFIDTRRFTPTKAVKNPHTITILFSGRLEKYKGVYDLLYAFAQLLADRSSSHTNLKLLMAGNGSERNNLRALERQLGIGNRISHIEVPYEQMPEVYREADIFVAPSIPTKTWEEQYCTALLEAQASGLAIVTTATGGILENIGDAGLVVPPGDIIALTRALMRFIVDSRLRKHYAGKARKRAETVHDALIGARKMKDFYTKILAG